MIFVLNHPVLTKLYYKTFFVTTTHLKNGFSVMCAAA